MATYQLPRTACGRDKLTDTCARVLKRHIAGLILPLFMAACGGGGSGGSNQPPLPVIVSPAEGVTFKGGDTLTFSANATDAIDGTLAPSQLTWWVDLHHDTHTHPLQPPTSGAGGTVTIPVRGENSDNIWYRFHLRAADSAGLQAEVVRDVLPVKAQITLATQPAGLQLTLDGKAVAAPYSFVGVAGMERDLTAANQVFNGRQYRFNGWSDGAAAAHTIATPAVAATFTASFADMGPAGNQAPLITLTAPATGRVGSALSLTASASDSDGTISKVEFFDGAGKIGEDSSIPFELSWTPLTSGLHTLTARATDNAGAASDSAPVSVNVIAAVGTLGPVVTLSAPANLAAGLTGIVNVAASAAANTALAAVEFEVDGSPLGAAVAAAPYQATLDTNLYASGQHVVRARGRDAAGNLSAWSSALVSFGGTRDMPQGFSKEERWITGLANATSFAQAPDGRLFVAEQDGSLRVVKNGVLLPAPFVQLTTNSVGERGLVGVALHPAFASNGWVYLYYTTPQNGIHNRISRFVANGDVASAGETILVDLPALSSATNHNGGAMHFGIDGKLYVGVGDNANGARAQNLAEPFGKMLRFNEDGSIPADNPFYTSQTGLARAVWAYGLRNPFSFAVQAGSGRIHINDVGENTWEEVDLGAAGANYGWPASEGPDQITAGVTAPLFTYKHKAATPPGSGPGGFFTGFSITGAAFYPAGGNFPATYRGNYFFADYVSRFVARMDLANDNAVYAFAGVGGDPVGLLTGLDGALYVLTRGAIVRIAAL